jgi:thiol-disulfide isomerase/thioredoxin
MTSYNINLLLNNDQITSNSILWYSADFCKPCKKVHEILNELIESYNITNNELNIYKINFDSELENVKLKSDISKLPTLIILDENLEEINRYNGADPDKIKEFISNFGELIIKTTDDF